MRQESIESDQVLKHEVCIVCKKVKAPHEQVKEGSICRSCVLTSTEVFMSWVINGRVYVKVLKGNLREVK